MMSIIVIDINGFEELKNRILNYVALSRAKILLYAFYYLGNYKLQYIVGSGRIDA